MRPQSPLAVTLMLASIGLFLQQSVQADIFGSGANTFTIDFVNIGNAGNAADTTGYGAVPYEYRIGKYEISQNQIDKATASGMSNVTAGAHAANRPAGLISWYEAAAFVNWMNTSTGKQAAYNLTYLGGNVWSMGLWSSSQAWTAGGTNLFRNKDTFYFLPSENEWYKAAYFNPAGTNYFIWPTGSDTAPTAVASGTNAGTAVYGAVFGGPISNVAPVTESGGLSPYGTMGQGGNVEEWNESAFDGLNDSPTENRTLRGGAWSFPQSLLRSSAHIDNVFPHYESGEVGFRVASVPEPSTYALMLLGAGALYCWRRWR